MASYARGYNLRERQGERIGSRERERPRGMNVIILLHNLPFADFPDLDSELVTLKEQNDNYFVFHLSLCV